MLHVHVLKGGFWLLSTFIMFPSGYALSEFDCTTFYGNMAICLEACSIPPMHSMSELKSCELGNLREGGGGVK